MDDFCSGVCFCCIAILLLSVAFGMLSPDHNTGTYSSYSSSSYSPSHSSYSSHSSSYSHSSSDYDYDDYYYDDYDDYK